MRLADSVIVVTGGASGLGLATATRVVAEGGRVVLLDLPTSSGAEVATGLGDAARFVPADVTDADAVAAALDVAAGLGEIRGLVHCAGLGAPVRIVDRNGDPGSLEAFESVIRVNLVGTFNVLRLTAARMAALEPVEGERGAVVLTASIAAFEGQIGQASYASSKGGIVALTLVAARDLASRAIRVCAIAPGVFDTPILDTVPAQVKASLAAGVPNPSRLGRPEEFASLALHILENPYLNGETIRIDGALRMPPR
jgi:NAD(P)-dependent dehydrogenase (short-subunit alcohol dehydrogenase family)